VKKKIDMINTISIYSQLQRSIQSMFKIGGRFLLRLQSSPGLP